MDSSIHKPIFFIGVPRSGTSIIFEAFSVQEELSWFPNVLETFPRFLFLARSHKIIGLLGTRGAKKQINKQSKLTNFLPHPAECYEIWKSCCGKKFLNDYLIGQMATDQEKKKLRQIITKVMAYQGKRRFSAKLTGPGRIHYLNSVFNDSIFIHIIRDGRAVVNSLMNAKFWKENRGYYKPWWKNGLTTEDYDIYKYFSNSPLALAALQWKRIISIAKEEASNICKNRYFELKYEDFIVNPHYYINKIFENTLLNKSKKVTTYLDERSNLNDQNFKYLKSIGLSDINMLNVIMGKTLEQLGYIAT